jgi:hypothetical protein
MITPTVKEKLKEPDDDGRFQVLGIYQNTVTDTTEQLEERLRNEIFVDSIIKEGGKSTPMLGFDHVRRDLIMVAYEDSDEEEFRQKVEKKLSKEDLKARKELFGTMEEVMTMLGGEILDKKIEAKEIDMHEHMQRYIGHDDILRRLTIHHIDDLLNVMEKDTSFIRKFYRKVQGKKYKELGGCLEEAQKVYDKAKNTRDTYGLTRDEVMVMGGSATNIIALQKGEESVRDWNY